MAKLFRALRVSETADGQYVTTLEMRSRTELPNHAVLVQVYFSALNYKDVLSAMGNRGVTRQYPHTPGIDAAGIVVESRAPQFRPGDRVIVTSYDLGMNTPGGWAEFIRVPADWIIPLPPGLTLKTAMIFGTAGLTAAIGIQRLLHNGLHPDQGPVIVTGSTGGVGCLAIALWAPLGYRVTAVTGKPQAHDWLTTLGATQILDRSAILTDGDRPLGKGIYAAGFDTVGGAILTALLKQLLPGGSVAACGLVAGVELETTLYPFILRGNSLLGIDSAQYPFTERYALWQKLATTWQPQCLEILSQTLTLAEVPPKLQQMLAGQLQGRWVIDINA